MLIFFQFSVKTIKSFVLSSNLPLIRDISQVFSKFSKFPVAIVNGSGSKASFCISPDHMINESRDLVGEIAKIYMYYKLAQLHYYKLGQELLQIGKAIIYKGNRHYKIWQLLQIGAKCITNQSNYYKLGHSTRFINNFSRHLQ